MAANPQGSNPFATNNSGGGVGLRTALPGVWGSPTQTLPAGQNTPYQTPDWIMGGLQQSSMPIQNYPVQNYNRWNWQNGATGGQGMSASGWPSPGSITQPGGPPGGGYPMPQGGMPGQSPQAPGQGGLIGMNPNAGNHNPYEGMTLQQKAAAGNTNATARLAADNPGAVGMAGSAFGQMGAPQQAQFLQQNPYMTAAMTNAGSLTREQINNLLGGSYYQSGSGQMLR